MFNHDGDLMRVQIVEKLSRALVKHVRIDAVSLEERHSPLPPRPLRLDALDLARQVGDLLVKLLARIDAIFPGKGVDAEITDEQRRHDVEAERRQKRTNPRTNNHRPFCAADAVNALLTPPPYPPPQAGEGNSKYPPPQAGEGRVGESCRKTTPCTKS